MTRFQRSIALAKASWAVLKSDRSLALFPVYSALVSIAIVAVLAVLGWATKGSEVNAAGHTHYTANAATFVIVAVGYLALAFVQTYFLAGLVASANERLNGRPTSVGQGLGVAKSRAGRLLPWAVVTATVSWILQSLEQRAGIMGRIVISLVGAAWSVVTFLTVPIIVFEDVGPVTALKRSGSLLKQTWGENIIGQGGLGLIALLPTLVAIGIGVAAVASNVLVVQVVGVAVAVLLLLATSVIMYALTGVYRTALYRYAVDGQVPSSFAGADLEHAFGPRKGVNRI
ncbi:MAG: DUF6159 family protein [Acidimicrobiia bacterium]